MSKGLFNENLCGFEILEDIRIRIVGSCNSARLWYSFDHLLLQKSGLSLLIGEQFEALNGLPDWVMLTVIVTIVAACTEVTSNTAITTLFLPILFELVSLNY